MFIGTIGDCRKISRCDASARRDGYFDGYATGIGSVLIFGWPVAPWKQAIEFS
jgi:hypothetical protein